MRIRTITVITAVAAATLLALPGCAAATRTETAAPVTQGESIRITDAWVKAADSGMSAAFGTLRNQSAKTLTVVSVESHASTTVQLHETVENSSGTMVMQEKKDGFTIPPKGRLELAPGGNHLMLMGITSPITAGDDVTFTLTMKDASTYTFTAPAKDYTGANETYQGEHTGNSHTPANSSANLGH